MSKIKSPILFIVIVIIALIAGGYFVYRYEKKGVVNPYNQAQNTAATNSGSVGNNMATVTVQPVQQIPLTVTSPLNNSSVSSSSITVTGTSVPDAEVSVNDTNTTADNKGIFSATISLDPGDNVIDITSNDASGNYSEKELTVTYAGQ